MILVTGGTGRIGKALVEELLKTGKDTRVFTRQNIYSKDYEVFKGDITYPQDVEKALKGVEVVFHLAKLKGHNRPFHLHERVTVLGTNNILKAAKKQGISKVIVMSSIAAKLKNKTPYALAKQKVEELCKQYWKDFEIPILRASLVYDSQILKKLYYLSFFPFPYVNQKIHLTYKRTLIQALIKSMDYGTSEIYEVGDKKPLLLPNFIKSLAAPRPVIFIPGETRLFLKILGYPVEFISNLFNVNPVITPKYIDYLFEDRILDIEKSKKELHYRPTDTEMMIAKFKKKEI
ncbi:MAG: NAD-dependent epimerase/dehydratase family protein [archaeon]